MACGRWIGVEFLFYLNREERGRHNRNSARIILYEFLRMLLKLFANVRIIYLCIRNSILMRYNNSNESEYGI